MRALILCNRSEFCYDTFISEQLNVLFPIGAKHTKSFPVISANEANKKFPTQIIQNPRVLLANIISTRKKTRRLNTFKNKMKADIDPNI